MGEHADDITEGRVCALCGCFFVDEDDELYEHGFPVACVGCWEKDCGYDQQDEEAFFI